MGAQSSITLRMGPVQWGLLITLSLLWGGSFFFAEVALPGFPPLTLVVGRVGLAAVALWFVLLLSGQGFPRGFRLWGAFLVMGALNNALPFSLIFWGQTQIASGLAAILNATTPIFTVILAHFLTADERMTPGKLAGVIAGFIGIIIMIGPETLGGLGKAVLAQFAVLAAAISYGFAGIFGRRFKALTPATAAAGQLSGSTLFMLPIALLHDRPWALPAPPTECWLALFGLAFLSTALAYVVYFRILRTSGATNLLLVTFLIPISAILLGVGILGENIEPTQIAGMAMIALGLAAIDGRLYSWLRRSGNRQTAENL